MDREYVYECSAVDGHEKIIEKSKIVIDTFRKNGQDIQRTYERMIDVVKKYNNDENFDEIIKNRVLVDFYADWCGPCRMLGPVLEKIDGIDIIKVNVDESGELARKYGVMSIPCVILFEDGKEIKRNIGFMNEEKVREFLG